eukprot:SAG31_NODE_1776_length_7300_cov_10.281905_5_plen_285_part_00
MTLQIARTDRAVDDCCRPIEMTLAALAGSRLNWVGGAVVELEAAAPEVVERMLGLTDRGGFEVNAQGQTVSLRSGRVVWDPATRPDGITRVHGTVNLASCGLAAACAIALADFITAYSKPVCNELPTAIIDHLTADPTSPLADSFRCYARRSMVPAMRRVTELLETHGAVVELPPLAWLESKFPEISWITTPPRMFRTQWLACTSLWEAFLEAWDGSAVGVVVPPGDNLPFAGLTALNEYAIARGEELQRELIGCAQSLKMVPHPRCSVVRSSPGPKLPLVLSS